MVVQQPGVVQPLAGIVQAGGADAARMHIPPRSVALLARLRARRNTEAAEVVA